MTDTLRFKTNRKALLEAFSCTVKGFCRYRELDYNQVYRSMYRKADPTLSGGYCFVKTGFRGDLFPLTSDAEVKTKKKYIYMNKGGRRSFYQNPLFDRSRQEKDEGI